MTSLEEPDLTLTGQETEGDGEVSGSLDFDALSESMPPREAYYAITVPGTMKVTGAVVEHVNGPTQAVRYQTIDVRRPIPTAKMAAVKAALAADSLTYTICYGGNGGAFRDGRGFRSQFKVAKTEAEVNTFLAAVESAVTT